LNFAKYILTINLSSRESIFLQDNSLVAKASGLKEELIQRKGNRLVIMPTKLDSSARAQDLTIEIDPPACV
jgi:hypothetical protein